MENINWDQIEFAVLLIRSGRIAAMLLEKELESMGLSVAQASILASIREWGDMTATDLCKLTMRDKANISTLLKKLEKSGHILTKKDSKDARQSTLTLTQKGKKDAQKVEKSLEKVSRRLEAKSDQIKDIRKFLKSLILDSGQL